MGKKPSCGVHPNVGRPDHQAIETGASPLYEDELGKQDGCVLWKQHLELGWQPGGVEETETGRTLGKCFLRERFLLVLDKRSLLDSPDTFMCCRVRNGLCKNAREFLQGKSGMICFMMSR